MTGGTSLRMLWEDADPVAMLRSRFGFPDVDAASSWLVDVVRDAWSLEVGGCDRVVLSASTLLAWLTVDGRSVVAKCSADPARHPRLAAVDAVVAWLHEQGFPVAAPIATDEGRWRVERGGLTVGLAPCVTGELLDVADLSQTEAAGRTLATLHRTLATYPREFGTGPRAPGHQLVHGDFRSANIVCDRGRIAAVLDFDEMGDGSPVADLSQAAVLLGTRYRDWAPTTPDVRAAFVTAYADVSPLTRHERKELDRRITAVADRFGWARRPAVQS